MADLQEELQRFLTARFGVDVKDAFVSCIQKIHKENQNVAALEQPMKDATQKVLDIREEVVTASEDHTPCMSAHLLLQYGKKRHESQNPAVHHGSQ